MSVLFKSFNNTDIEHSTRLKKLDAALEKIKFDRTAKNQEISDQKSCIFETQRNLDRMENDKAHLFKDWLFFLFFFIFLGHKKSQHFFTVKIFFTIKTIITSSI